jgi:hypothetical protein
MVLALLAVALVLRPAGASRHTLAAGRAQRHAGPTA